MIRIKKQVNYDKDIGLNETCPIFDLFRQKFTFFSIRFVTIHVVKMNMLNIFTGIMSTLNRQSQYYHSLC